MKKIDFSDVELELLKRLFQDLGDRYTCAGCNEMDITSTPEMNLLVATIEDEWYEQARVPKEERIELGFSPDGKIRTMDSIILGYFERKFGLEKKAKKKGS